MWCCSYSLCYYVLCFPLKSTYNLPNKAHSPRYKYSPARDSLFGCAVTESRLPRHYYWLTAEPSHFVRALAVSPRQSRKVVKGLLTPAIAKRQINESSTFMVPMCCMWRDPTAPQRLFAKWFLRFSATVKNMLWSSTHAWKSANIISNNLPWQGMKRKRTSCIPQIRNWFLLLRKPQYKPTVILVGCIVLCDVCAENRHLSIC